MARFLDHLPAGLDAIRMSLTSSAPAWVVLAAAVAEGVVGVLESPA